MVTTRLTDEEFFTKHLDTSIPELSEAAALFAAGKEDEAKHVFAAYVRAALKPELYLADKREALAKDAKNIRAKAQRVFEHTFVSCRVPFTFADGVIDWESNPTYNGYREWTWQLNRHPEWKALAQYYLLTGDEAAPQEWVRELISWTKQAQVPENESGYATKCWRTIEAGIRMSCWIYCIHAFLPSPAVTDEILTVFCKSLWEHGWRLRNFCTSHNWLIMEMHGLGRIALFFPFFRESAEWAAYSDRRLEEELDVQLYPDGMQYELSTGYHYVNVSNYQGVVDMYAQAGKEPPAYLRSGLKRMYDMYPRMMRPDLKAPTMNDGGNLELVGLYRPNARKLFPDDPVYRWIDTERAEGAPPAFLSYLFAWGGVAIFRDSWKPDALWAYMDGGPWGKAHQHEDKLNVQIYGYGHELIPEAGTFDYDTSLMRKYVLSTRGHNTARIDGQDQNRRAGYVWDPEDIKKEAGMVFSSAPDREFAEAVYDEGYGPDKDLSVTHKRKLIFLKKPAGLPPLFLTVDDFTASDGKQHSYELIWHLHDNPTTISGRLVENAYEDGVGVAVTSSAGSVNLVRGMKSPEFQGWLPKHGVGDVEHYPIPTILNTGLFTGAARVVTVLCPYRFGVNPVAAVAEENGKIVITKKDGAQLTLDP